MRSTYQIVKDGLLKAQADHAAKEAQKLGDLRAGNTGVVLPGGSIAGKCARLTYLRLIGVDAESEDFSREFMFGAGRTNEDSWVEMLVNGGILAEDIRREEDWPIEWTVASGRKVTGRPDIVIGERVWPHASSGLDIIQPPTFVPKKVLELKLICSIWTARDVAIKGEPKAMHVFQAAHYAWKLNTTAELWYTCRSDFAIGWSKQERAMWPRQGEPGSEYLEYNEKGDPKKVIPFVTGYELKWNAEDVLEYRRLGEKVGMWHESIVTKKGIEEYFETVDRMTRTKEMPPRPVNVSVRGERGGYSICDYCPLKPVCEKRETGGLDSWVDEVRKWVPQLPQTGSLKIKEKK